MWFCTSGRNVTHPLLQYKRQCTYFPTDVFVPKLPDNLRSSSNTLFHQPLLKVMLFCILLSPFPVHYGISYLCLLQTHQHYYHLKSHYLNICYYVISHMSFRVYFL